MSCRLAITDGRLMAIPEGKEAVPVRLLRARPRTAPDGELVALDEKKREVWMWSGLDEFDAASRAVAVEALRERYHQPVITAVRSIAPQFGAWHVEVVTDAGERRFALRHPERSVEMMDDGRVLLRDVLGNRYVVPDPEKLDARSRRELDRLR